MTTSLLPQKPTHERKLFFSLLGIKIVLICVAYVFLSASFFTLGSDGKDYYELGNNLLFGDGFGRVLEDKFSFADDRTPLYPIIVAGSAFIGGGSSTLLLALFQAVIATFIGVLAFRIARRILPVAWSLFFAIALALEPVAAGLHLLAYAETLLTFFILLAIEYTLRAIDSGKLQDIIIAGVAIACASYTKPVAVYFGAAVIVAVFFLAGRMRWKMAGVFLAVVILLLAPWVARNALRTGNVTFTTFGEKVFCGYQLSAYYAARDHFPDATPAYAMGRVLNDEPYRSAHARCVAERDVLGQTVSILRESPLAFFKANSIVLFAYLTNDGMGQLFDGATTDASSHNAHLSGIVLLGTEWREQIRDAFQGFVLWQQVVVVVLRVFWVGTLLLAIVGAFLLVRTKAYRALGVLLLISIVYFSGATVLAGGLGAGARYRYAINYQLVMLALVCVRMLTLAIPQTRAKLIVARMLSAFAQKINRGRYALVTRAGIVYNLDLTEGIDLSLYVFGNFQKHITHNRLLRIPADGVVFDVGGNIGAMSLQFAQQVPQGRVYAFEPTAYGIDKFTKNLQCNPVLQSRITLTQIFVSSVSTKDPHMTAYARWNVSGERSVNAHHVHGGEPMATQHVPAMTLDDIVSTNHVERIDLIKIDTDGYEWDILQGGRRTIEKLRPKIIFEVGRYVLEEHRVTFEQIEEYFAQQGYVLFTSDDGDLVTKKNWKWRVPKYGTIDIIALPAERRTYCDERAISRLTK